MSVKSLLLDLEFSSEMREFNEIVKELENTPKTKVYFHHFPSNDEDSGKSSTAPKKLDEFEELEMAIKALDVKKEDDVSLKKSCENRPVIEEAHLEVEERDKKKKKNECNLLGHCNN